MSTHKMRIHDLIMAVLSFMVVPLVIRAERLYRRMPNLTQTTAEQKLPTISIIVPARNEAVNLHRLLPSLQAQTYPGDVQLIVVNDNSTDNTAIVANYYGAQVVSLTQLPDGWLGKPNAVHQGVQHAQGEWLLFTDADMDYAPTALETAVQYALDHQLDGLSLFPRQMTLGPIDRIALMVGFAGLFAGLRKENHTLNGQFVLLRRDVYDASGGMTAVRQEMLEDLAFGVHLHQQGYRVPMVRGEEIADVYMYENLGHMWHGMTRLGSGSLKYSGAGSLITALFIAGTLMPLITPFFVAAKLVHKRWLALTWITAVPGYISWGKRFGSGIWAIFAPFGALIVQMAALSGFASRYLGRGILWKNRAVK